MQHFLTAEDAAQWQCWMRVKLNPRNALKLLSALLQNSESTIADLLLLLQLSEEPCKGQPKDLLTVSITEILVSL